MARSVAAAPSEPERVAGIEPAARPGADGLDTDSAHDLLSDVGFLLVHGRPLDQGSSYLLVALRPKPTLLHFDPERVEYWSAHVDQAEAQELSWPIRTGTSDYSLGTIRIVDRVGASNSFISFGGELSLSRDSDVGAVLFRSPVPILALHGRSGPSDPLATNICAFVAVLRGAATSDRALARKIIGATPIALYAAFIERTLALYQSEPGRAGHVRLVSLLRMERRQLQAEAPAEAAAGIELAARL